MKSERSSMSAWERFLAKDDERQRAVERQEAGLFVSLDTVQEPAAPVKGEQKKASSSDFSKQLSRKMRRAFASLTEEQQQMVLERCTDCRKRGASPQAVVTEVCSLIEGFVRFNKLGTKPQERPIPVETAKLRREVGRHLRALKTASFIQSLEQSSKSPKHPEERIM